MFEKSSAIENLSFYNILTEAQKNDVYAHSEIKKFKKGEIISGLVKPCLGPCLILDGTVRAIMDDENFREITLFKLYPNDIALLSASCVLEYIAFDAKFVVETDSVLLTIESCALKRIMDENIAVKCAILEMLTDRFSSCMLTMHELLFTRYERRMASFLVERYIYTGETEFCITQEEIAKMTSSAREVAGKTIRQFAADGILEYGRGKIKLLDIQKLKDMM